MHEVVTVHHPALDVTQVVTRSKLRQMDPRWEVVTDSPETLKGKDLDQALEDAGLPKTGNADEKRARLAEHKADQSATSDPQDRGAADTTENTEE